MHAIMCNAGAALADCLLLAKISKELPTSESLEMTVKAAMQWNAIGHKHKNVHKEMKQI